LKAYNIKHTNGVFFDIESGKQIKLKNGTFIVSGKDDLFIENDVSEAKNELSDDSLFHYQLQASKGNKVVQIAEKGQFFAFRMGLGKKAAMNENQYGFIAQLKEDLYIYSKDQKNWRLCRSLVVLKECFFGEIEYFHELESNSLNELYSITFNTFFAAKGSGTANVFDRFFPVDNPSELRFEQIQGKGAIHSIGHLRKLITIIYNPKISKKKKKPMLYSIVNERKIATNILKMFTSEI